MPPTIPPNRRRSPTPNAEAGPSNKRIKTERSATPPAEATAAQHALATDVAAAPVALNLRGTTLELPRNHVPASVLAHLARTGSSYLDVSRADFDALLDVYRRRGISPRRDAKDVLNLQETARYLQDAYVQFEIKQVLPLRRAAHAAKGTAAYPRHLEALATKLEEVSRRENEPRDLMLAQRKRVRAAEFVAAHPAAQPQRPAMRGPQFEPAAAAGQLARPPQQQPAVAIMPTHPNPLTQRQQQMLPAQYLQMQHAQPPQQQPGLGPNAPAPIVAQPIASSSGTAGQSLDTGRSAVQSPREAATTQNRPGTVAANIAGPSQSAGPQNTRDELRSYRTFASVPPERFRTLTVEDIRSTTSQVWETVSTEQVRQLGLQHVYELMSITSHTGPRKLRRMIADASILVADERTLRVMSKEYFVNSADDVLASLKLEMIRFIPAAVYGSMRATQSAALPLAHIASMTPEQARALVENEQKHLSAAQTAALLARL